MHKWVIKFLEIFPEDECCLDSLGLGSMKLYNMKFLMGYYPKSDRKSVWVMGYGFFQTQSPQTNLGNGDYWSMGYLST